jgi:uncharacterized protein (TIGR02757 family)
MEFGSLRKLFEINFKDIHPNIIPALSCFSSNLVGNIKFSDTVREHYFNYLIPNPQNGSSCKRLNLFLRWMIRSDEIDLGIWNEIQPSKLVIPVDIHITRAAKKLKLVKRKSIDLKFALELTDKLRQFDPVDPVKYDFSLCHYQMEGRSF